MNKLIKIMFLFSLVFIAGCSSTGKYTFNDNIPIMTDTKKALLEGKSYIYSYDLNLDDKESKSLILCTSNITNINKFDIKTNQTPINFNIYTNTSINSSGNTTKGFNLERNYADNHKLKIYNNSILNNNGTKIYSDIIYTNSHKDIFPYELMLNTNECYTLQLISNNNNTQILFNMVWNE